METTAEERHQKTNDETLLSALSVSCEIRYSALSFLMVNR